jgi:hypothetical protein
MLQRKTSLANVEGRKEHMSRGRRALDGAWRELLQISHCAQRKTSAALTAEVSV